MTDWNPIEQPTDRVILAGQASPGIAEVDQASVKRDYDERRGPALSGARLRFRGTKLCRPIVRIRLYTVEDWEAWNEWSRQLQRAPDGTRPGAIDIEHPILEAQGVTSVVVDEVGQPVRTKDDGEWTIEIKFIEHRAPVPTLVGIDGSVADQGDDNPEVGRRTRILADLMAEEDAAALGASAAAEAGL